MFKHILIAYDESKEACKALDTGVKLAVELRAKTTVLTVLEPVPGYVHMAGAVAPEYPQHVLEERRLHFTECQQRARKRASDHGLEIETVLVEGDEIEAILEYTRKSRADLLVLGLHRHRSGIEWQSTMRCIANETPCPILAVC